ncbi:hypothetical protein U9M48_005542 [Paspalum notatum var. saurae]|uniref:WRKY domain-containing protein n=1 Tax=Paspalum notatum var. saurae TaxID=547442 RepID=A0AAQ3SIM4_PASNO
MIDLHDLVLPILDPYSAQAKRVQQLFEEVFSCSSKIVSYLELGDNSRKQANLIHYKRKGGKNNVENHILEEKAKDIGSKRRKNVKHIESVVTQAPYIDGYQWRKYGQKQISKAKYSRSYYRCAYNKEQGCLATKTVQEKQTDGNGTARLFNVNYYGQHICKMDGKIHPHVAETTHDSATTVSHHQNISSTSVYNGVHGIIQDESFGNLFMVPETPEYFTDFIDGEMAKALEITSINIPLISEDIWA